MRVNKKTGIKQQRRQGGLISLCLAAVLVLVVSAGVFSQRTAETQALSDNGQATNFTEEVVETAYVEQEQSEPLQIASDAVYGDYEKGKMLLAVDRSTDIEALNAVLAVADFTETKSISEQDLYAGYVEIDLADGVAMGHAITTFEAAGYTAQPNYVYYPAGDLAETEEELSVDTEPIDAHEPFVEAAVDTEESEEAEPQNAATITRDNDWDTVMDLFAVAVPADEQVQRANTTTQDTETEKDRTSEQWALTSLNLPQAWGIQKCNGSVSVAVIDTGAYVDHSDLKANIKGTYNTESTTTSSLQLATQADVSDENGHGTHVAGIVSAVANDFGVTGTSYNAGLYIIKSSTKNDKGESVFSTTSIARGYSWLLNADETSRSATAIAGNVRVVNMSVGAPNTSSTTNSADRVLYNKITAAKGAGILTVCAAGNDNATIPYKVIPGEHEDCFTVINLNKNGSGDKNDSSGKYCVQVDGTSNYNVSGAMTKRISAPGTAILSTSSEGSYVSMTGTSMASPAVAGAAALLFAYDSELPVTQAQALLEKTATYLGSDTNLVWDQKTGYGEADPYHALQILDAAIANDNLQFGETVPLDLVCGDGSHPSAAEWNWSSKDPSVLSVNNSNHTVSVKGTGSTELKAVFNDRGGNVLRTISKKVNVAAISPVADDLVVTVADDDIVYDGSEKQPAVTVSFKGVPLTKEKDYTLTYKNNINANAKNANNDSLHPKVTVTLKSDPSVTKSQSFTILPADIAGVDQVSIPAQTYTGNPVVPPYLTCSFKGTALVRGEDYEVSSDAIGPCDQNAVAKLIGKGNFTGTKEALFTIQLDLEEEYKNDQISIKDLGSYPYTGSAIVPDLQGKIYWRDQALTFVRDVDYTVECTNNIQVSSDTQKAKITIEGKGLYKGTLTADFTIVKKDIGTGGVTVKVDSVQYTGNALTPAPTVTYGTRVLKAGTDYKVSGYSNNTDVGRASVKIEGLEPNFTGSISQSFEITPISISNAAVSGYKNLVYNGKNQTQGSVVVKLNNKQLIPGTDYFIWYRKLGSNASITPNEVGVYQMVVQGRGVYSGMCVKNFQVTTNSNTKSISGATVTSSNMIRNTTGKALAPSVTVKYGSTTLKAGTDYYLTYNNSQTAPTQAGTYTVRVVGKGGYAGSKEVGSFKVYQAPSIGSGTQVRISSLSNSTYVLDASGATPKIGANVTIWTDNGGNNQKWYLVPDGNGFYTIRSASNTNFLLDAANTVPSRGSNISIWTSNGGANQKWVLEPSVSGTYVIRNAANPSLALDASGATPKIGANVSAWSVNYGNNQKWKISSVTTPSFDSKKMYEISSASNSGYVLDASGATPKIGANVTIWTKNGGKNQRWYLVPDGKGYYYIRSASNQNFLLDAANKVPSRGSNISIWTSNGGNNQKWKIEQLANGTYLIRSAANPNLVLDASGATPKRGANVSVWTCNGGNNQKWNIRAV